MKKEEIIDLFGNVLIGITCPFLFLSDDPIKLLKKEKVEEGNTTISKK